MTGTKDKQKSADGLKGRLENYSAAARAGAAKSTLRQRMGNWPIYAAATGSAMAMATNASAGIIYYSGAPITASAPGTPGFSFKSVGVGAATFHLSVSHYPGNPHGDPQAVDGAVTAGPYGGSFLGNGNPRNLALGATISAGATGGFSGRQAQLRRVLVNTDPASTSIQGNWVAGVPGFEGFRFATGLGGVDYGWAELEVGADGNGIPDSVTLLGLAYDNTGAAIDVGQTVATPEPGSAGLMLLALGAAGVALLRKRKQIPR